jgi:hypothetical protein
MKILPKNLLKVRRLSLVLRAQVVLFKIRMMSYKRLIKILKYNLMFFWASTLKPSSTPETTKASNSNGCERCYNIDINALCAQNQYFNVKQVLV